jgi:hypothetical protein
VSRKKIREIGRAGLRPFFLRFLRERSRRSVARTETLWFQRAPAPTKPYSSPCPPSAAPWGRAGTSFSASGGCARTDCGILGGALLGLEPRSTKFMLQSSQFGVLSFEFLCLPSTYRRLLTAYSLLSTVYDPRSTPAPHFSLITNSRQPRPSRQKTTGHKKRESGGQESSCLLSTPLLPTPILLTSYLPRYVSALTVHFSPSPLHPRPHFLRFTTNGSRITIFFTLLTSHAPSQYFLSFIHFPIFPRITTRSSPSTIFVPSHESLDHRNWLRRTCPGSVFC